VEGRCGKFSPPFAGAFRKRQVTGLLFNSALFGRVGGGGNVVKRGSVFGLVAKKENKKKRERG